MIAEIVKVVKIFPSSVLIQMILKLYKTYNHVYLYIKDMLMCSILVGVKQTCICI